MPVTTFSAAVQSVTRDGKKSREVAQELLDQLSLDERLSLLDGDFTLWEFAKENLGHYNIRPIPAARNARIGLPGILFSDGPRGATLGNSTAFPSPSSRAAAWNPDLEEEIGIAIGKEISAQGGNLYGGVCVNLARHPGWGRAQEAYGEDPLLLGTMGAALSRGTSRYTMPTVKHFALNSMEIKRFEVDVTVDEAVLHECYLPHFKQVLDEGNAAAIMSAYNSVNSEHCGDSMFLLKHTARDVWGCEDIIIISDFLWGTYDAANSIKAGLDIEMPNQSVRMRFARQALAQGKVTQADIDKIALRVINAQLLFALRQKGMSIPPKSVVACDAHRSLARRAAAEGMVLLKNASSTGQALLPLDRPRIKRVLVVGKLAQSKQTGDNGSSAVSDLDIVSPWDGLSNRDFQLVYSVGSNIAEAISLANHVDAIVMIAGFTGHDEGEFLANINPAINTVTLPGLFRFWLFCKLIEIVVSVFVWWHGALGGDRSKLNLRVEEEALATAMAERHGDKMVLGVSAGSTVILPHTVRDKTAAIIMLGYGGSRVGEAIHDVLFGDAEPSGRLANVMPEREEDLPAWDPLATKVVYDKWWGYRKMNRDGVRPAYPFGFGLGYGQVELVQDSLELPKGVNGRFFDVTVKAHNSSRRDTLTVVQIYAGRTDGMSADEYKNVLVGFKKVAIRAGGTATVSVACRLNPLARYEPAARIWTIRRGKYALRASRYEGDKEAVVVDIELDREITWK